MTKIGKMIICIFLIMYASGIPERIEN